MIEQKEFEISGGGLVRYVSHMGSDADIDAIARPQDAKSDLESTHRDAESVKRLLTYMIKHRHTSPFEFGKVTVFVKCPIFVARQWMRHRTGSYSEQSARYTVLYSFYRPPVSHMRASSPTRKQGSSDDCVPEQTWAQDRFDSAVEESRTAYKGLMLDVDLSRETARAVLPLATMTSFYWTTDLHNILHFIRLRAASDAQFQMQEYAQAIAAIVRSLFPITWSAYNEHVINTVTLTNAEYEELKSWKINQ